MNLIYSVISAEWESMKGTSNRVGMATLKEIMSGDITTLEEGFRMSNFGSVFQICAFNLKNADGHQNRFENLY